MILPAPPGSEQFFSNWPLRSLSRLQVPKPTGDVHSYGRGIGRLLGFSVGRREQSCDQQLQEAEPHSVCDRHHGRQLHFDLYAGERHGVYDCNHFTSGL